VTAAGRPAEAEAEAGPAPSVRQAPGTDRRVVAGLLLLLVAVEVIAGWRVLGPSWQGGDMLYHGALANAILRGELPPGGPYAGLPAYYPPGFHVVLATLMAGMGLDVTAADQLLTLAWIPVLPLGTFLLVRWLTGRPWVALLAATLTAFGGAYDLSAGRLWVNSLFMGGHLAYPAYPRDLVFGALPFAILAFLRSLAALRERSAAAWAVTAGVLFGACALVQVQLLLPIPPALAAVSLVVAIRRPERRWRALWVLVVTGAIALALFCPWLLGQLELIRRNGGVALDSADTLLAASYGPWSWLRQFGLLLPLGIVGSGVACLLLRRPDGPRPGGCATGPWRPALPEGPLALVAWFVLAFALAVLYRPDWPLEDALRPQRLWLLSSQPMTMLAAIGLATIAEDLAGRQRPTASGRAAIVAATVTVTVLVACVPATVATTRLLAETWVRPTYAHLDLERDRVPEFADLLPRATPRATVLTYEDWSSLLWYQTGEPVVALVPAGFAKLAFDPQVFTGRSQADRRDDLLGAFDGDPSHLAAVAEAYDARTIVLARRGDRLALVDASAAISGGRPGAVTGDATIAEGNGWDGLALAPGASLDLPVAATGPIDLEIRVLANGGSPSGEDRRMGLAVVAPDGTIRSETALPIPSGPDDWAVARVAVQAVAGDRLRVRAVDPLTIQSVRGFVDAGPVMVGGSPVPGWTITDVTDDAVVLEPGA
jgi:hypothetical protein